MMKYSKKYIEQLEKKYFDGLTSDEEENVLKDFLATNADGFDELRAVMSFLSVGRNINAAKDEVHIRRHHSHTWYAAAAIAVLMILGTVYLKVSESTQDVCVAYVYGKKITDANAVMNQMHQSMQQVKPDEASSTFDGQLGDMVKTLNEN
jgi:hypothetical protein